jgi:preprotein translocase subunit SecF
MPSLVLYAFASIGFVSVVGFAVLLALVIGDRVRQDRHVKPAHKRPRAMSDSLEPNIPA